jgi:hypothetical protein
MRHSYKPSESTFRIGRSSPDGNSRTATRIAAGWRDLTTTAAARPAASRSMCGPSTANGSRSIIVDGLAGM